jgi:hypothetical protein
MKIRPKLSYANVMVTLLAFVVLFGGAAIAADQLGKNSVGSRQLKKSSVTSAKVKDRSLKERDFAKGVLLTGPQGAQGPPGSSHAYEASGSVNYEDFSSSLFGSTVVSLPVPPGAYAAIAAVEADTANATASSVLCRLIDGNGGPGSTATSRAQTVPAEGAVENFTLTGVFGVSAGESLNLQCSKSAPASSARVTEANIVAVQVEDISRLR